MSVFSPITPVRARGPRHHLSRALMTLAAIVDQRIPVELADYDATTEQFRFVTGNGYEIFAEVITFPNSTIRLLTTQEVALPDGTRVDVMLSEDGLDDVLLPLIEAAHRNAERQSVAH